MLTEHEIHIRRRAAGIREERSEEAEAGGIITAEDGRNLARLLAATEAIAKGLSGGG